MDLRRASRRCAVLHEACAHGRGSDRVRRAQIRGTPSIDPNVTELSADGASLNPRDPIRIPSSRRRITFSYAGLSLSVPERVRFRYRVDGFDSDWSAPVAERQAVYTNLAPGHYRFRVIASNGDVVACCRDLEHRTVLGNLFQEDLLTIWNGERYRALRANLASGNPGGNAACRDCDMPWDGDKLGLRHMLDRAVHRLGILK